MPKRYRNPPPQVWPDQLESKIKTGFSAPELGDLCAWDLAGYDKELPYRPAPWLYWTVELYSFGRCYRDWLGLPSWLPLPLYGDHGVCLNGELSEHEVSAKPRIHLTWFLQRAAHNRTLPRKKVLRIPHPWITYRRKYGYTQAPQASGTLVFYAHSNTGIEIVDYEWPQYFESLKRLPANYKPLVICMHRHDIEKGYHNHVARYGIPIISAGETSSPYFVDRFYSMISQFKYATSNSGGSELFICEELGVRFFLMGPEPSRVNLSRNDLPLGVLKPQDSIAENAVRKKNKLFSQFPPQSSPEKDLFLIQTLGLDLNSSAAKRQLQLALASEYLRHISEMAVTLPRIFRQRLTKIISRAKKI